jgi:dynein heavy chain
LSEDELKNRVSGLQQALRVKTFQFISQSLFGNHKLVFLSNVVLRLIKRGLLVAPNASSSSETEQKEEITAICDSLIFGAGTINPNQEEVSLAPLPPSLAWLGPVAWMKVQQLAQNSLLQMQKLPKDFTDYSYRFKAWVSHPTAETEPLPYLWSSLDQNLLKKLLIVQALRPDRYVSGMVSFITSILSTANECLSFASTHSYLELLQLSFHHCTSKTPIFCIQTTTESIIDDVEKLAFTNGYERNETFFAVSLGQGQDVVADKLMKAAMEKGHFILLINVHLMPDYISAIQDYIASLSTRTESELHPKFRLVLTSQITSEIPSILISNTVKVSTQATNGFRSTLLRILANFSADTINELEAPTRVIWFSLCIFHAVIMERQKFGAVGYNKTYPFSIHDLSDSVSCLLKLRNEQQLSQEHVVARSGSSLLGSRFAQSSSSSSEAISWVDLKYLVGEIIYGGHITDELDRNLCLAYLDHFLRDGLFDEVDMVPPSPLLKLKSQPVSPSPTFHMPLATTYQRYVDIVLNGKLEESPLLYGLHPNTQIDLSTKQSNTFSSDLMAMEERNHPIVAPSSASSSAGTSSADNAAAGNPTLQAIFDMLPQEPLALPASSIPAFSPVDIPTISRSPFEVAMVLEVQAMNRLVKLIRKDLEALSEKLKGTGAFSAELETLELELSSDRLPSKWNSASWNRPASFSLTQFRALFSLAISQLIEWTSLVESTGSKKASLPCASLPCLFFPHSYMLAISQHFAEKMKAELEKIRLECEVCKGGGAQAGASKSGQDSILVTGLSLQNGSLNPNSMYLEPPIEGLFSSQLPTVACRASVIDPTTASGAATTSGHVYSCPVYTSDDRGQERNIFFVQLRSAIPAKQWTITGTAITFSA